VPIAAQPEAERESKPEDNSQNKLRRKHPGRQTLPSHLARVEQIAACTAVQCTCGQCGVPTRVIGYEETEVLDVKPAEYFVTVVKRENRACSKCEEHGVRTAAAPDDVRLQTLFVPQLLPSEHEPAHIQIAEQRTDYSPYTKGNFEFERVVRGWRSSDPVLDLRLKR
jgi:hypothetical protein